MRHAAEQADAFAQPALGHQPLEPRALRPLPRDRERDAGQVGQRVEASKPLFWVISGKPWIEANFKEDQLAHMRVGQPAEVTFDAYKGLKLKGHVQSIGAGTGSDPKGGPSVNSGLKNDSSMGLEFFTPGSGLN